MKVRLILFSVAFFNELIAKELFTKDVIQQYLTQENPFVYETVAKEYIYKEKEKYYLGDFDTKFSVKYEQKEYPVSEADFLDVTLQKPLENGIEFLAGYRDAEGVQEYNNIKTGKEGEARLGVTVPVVSVLKNMSTRKLNLYSAILDTNKLSYESKNNVRLLQYQIFSVYYKLLYFQATVKLENELYVIAQNREEIIKKKVSSGLLADVALLEAHQQIINRKQRLVSAHNDFDNTLKSFLQYINLSKEQFEELYELPLLEKIEKSEKNIDEAIELALQNRPDLKIFEYEIQKADLQEQHNAIDKYPQLNVAMYGVHDFEYESGFKIALNMDFPIEQRKYEGKSAEIKKSVQNLENTKKKQIILMKTNITNSINSLHNILENIKSSQDEVKLVEKLQEVENKKYNLGQSNLFMVNQREMYTLEVKKKLFNYYLDYLLLKEELNKEMGNQV